MCAATQRPRWRTCSTLPVSVFGAVALIVRTAKGTRGSQSPSLTKSLTAIAAPGGQTFISSHASRDASSLNAASAVRVFGENNSRSGSMQPTRRNRCVNASSRGARNLRAAFSRISRTVIPPGLLLLAGITSSAASLPSSPRPATRSAAFSCIAPGDAMSHNLAPKPLAPEAFHGVLGECVRANDPYTESDPAAVLVTLYVLAGNVIGRGPHAYADGTRHGCNENELVIGRSGDSRKGTSRWNAQQFIAPADQAWARERIQGGLSSGEGLLHAIRDKSDHDLGVQDKRLCIVETEFASVLTVMKRNGNTVSELIRQAFDSQALNILTKNNAARCNAPHISAIAHITPPDLHSHLDGTDVGNGLLNRFLLVYSTRSKLLPESPRMPDSMFHALSANVAGAVDYAKNIALLQRDDAAKKLWDEKYADLTSNHPGVYGSLVARGAAHVMRLSMIAAVMDRSHWIRHQHLSAALAIWRYHCDTAQFIFGDALGDHTADALLSAIRASESGLTRTEMMLLFKRNVPATQIESALATMAQLHMIARTVDSTRPGRPVERWRAVRNT